MLNLTDHLRRLKVDKYEYVAMKVIVLLSSGEFLLNRTLRVGLKDGISISLFNKVTGNLNIHFLKIIF